MILLALAPSPTPVVVINNISDNSVVGDNFSVDFSLSNAQIGSSFYYKIFGGIGESTSSVQTFYNSNYLSYTSSWTDFPVLVVGDTNPILVNANSRINNSAGVYNIRIRVAKVSNTSSKYDSEPKSIDIIAPTSTPTPNPTSTPIPTIKSTPTPTKTPIPTTIHTPTKIPPISMSKLSPTSEITPTPEPSITPEPEILGAQTTSSEINIPEVSKPKNNKVGIIFIIIGGLLLLSPLLVTKLQQLKNKNK